jgi:hypothetical protein
VDQDVDKCKALRTECSERERKSGPNKKKIREFMIHATTSVRIAIDAGNFECVIASLFVASLNVK